MTSDTKIDPTKTRMVQEWKHTSPLIGARFDPTGRFVFATSQDNSLQRWTLADGKKTPLTGHPTWARALAFAAKERWLFSGDYSGRILTWPFDAETPQPLRTLVAHRGWVRTLAVSPDGRWLASAGNDNLVRLWSVADGKPVRDYVGHANHVYALGFHPKGEWLVSADLKGVVKLWDLHKGPVVREFDAGALFKFDTTFQADHGGVRALTFTPDGGLLACAGITEVSNAFAGVGKPAVLLFETKTGQRKQTLVPKANFQGTAWGVIAHPEGFFAAAGGGSGGALWFWKADQAQAFHTVALPTNARDLAIHPDGRRLAIPFFDGAIRLYEMSAKVEAKKP